MGVMVGVVKFDQLVKDSFAVGSVSGLSKDIIGCRVLGSRPGGRRGVGALSALFAFVDGGVVPCAFPLSAKCWLDLPSSSRKRWWR